MLKFLTLSLRLLLLILFNGNQLYSEGFSAGTMAKVPMDFKLENIIKKY